jgi:hypothetical protein
MTAVEIVGLLLKVVLGISAAGVLGKAVWPHSRLFRSHRHEVAQELVKVEEVLARH